jgi:hypothetical protein
LAGLFCLKVEETQNSFFFKREGGKVFSISLVRSSKETWDKELLNKLPQTKPSLSPQTLILTQPLSLSLSHYLSLSNLKFEWFEARVGVVLGVTRSGETNQIPGKNSRKNSSKDSSKDSSKNSSKDSKQQQKQQTAANVTKQQAAKEQPAQM